MASFRARLDRFLASAQRISRREVRWLLIKGRVTVDGVPATDVGQLIHSFSVIALDGRILQARPPVYLVLHKPVGVVSATRDARHVTVLDLVPAELREGLHLAGRLDINSSGLVLLTNDGVWSRRLTTPGEKVVKTYRVTVQHPITDACIRAFAEGMYFPFEDLTTQPAVLERESDCVAWVHLVEGRYHQIKRMFGRFRNPVLALHRVSIGAVVLDPTLAPGESRMLSESEVQGINLNTHPVGCASRTVL